MGLFSLLLLKLLPLYATIGMGWFAGKRLAVERESVGRIVFYLLAPLIMFSGVMRSELSASTLMLPFITFAFASALSLLFLWISRRIWSDPRANIVGCTAGTGNTGYFGLPVAMALFDEATVANYILLILGTSLAESSVGFFIAACGKSSVRESIMKVVKLPLLYAFILGVALKLGGIGLPTIAWDFLGNVRGAYTILGMMIVGLGLSGMRRLKLDGAFVAVCFLAKFVAWPVFMFALVMADRLFFGFYPENIHHALLLLSIVPMAANTVVIATILGIEPEKVASAVFLSYCVAVFYVPIAAALFIGAPLR